jgi:hypothetical protein
MLSMIWTEVTFLRLFGQQKGNENGSRISKYSLRILFNHAKHAGGKNTKLSEE